jgi:hypothetical protein
MSQLDRLRHLTIPAQRAAELIGISYGNLRSIFSRRVLDLPSAAPRRGNKHRLSVAELYQLALFKAVLQLVRGRLPHARMIVERLLVPAAPERLPAEFPVDKPRSAHERARFMTSGRALAEMAKDLSTAPPYYLYRGPSSRYLVIRKDGFSVEDSPSAGAGEVIRRRIDLTWLLAELDRRILEVWDEPAEGAER